jgi:D-alanyl-D-alanine dipeptidase
LKKQGYTIKIWDAYRPLSAQQVLWNTFPNPNFVAKPDPKNIRGHQLGATLDMTLCTLTGKEVQMQSKFDDFSSRAYWSYKRNSVQEKHYQIMDKAMRQAGFVGYSKEWWHYSDTNQNFKPLQVNPSLY